MKIAGPVSRPALAIFALSGALAAAVGFGGGADERFARYVAFGVPVVATTLVLALATVAVALVLAVRRARPSWSDLAAVTMLLALVAATAWLVPGRMRIQADEYQLAGTALGLRLSGMPIVATAAIVSSGGIEPIGTHVDKRGLLVPILYAGAQRVLATPVESLANVNTVLFALAVLCAWAVARRWLPPWPAAAVASVIATFPPLVAAARSLGLEAGNLALLGASTWLALAAIVDRRRSAALALAWLAPLLAQARYESVVPGAAFWLLSCSAVLRFHPHDRRVRTGVAAACLGFVPYAWQRAMPFDHGPIAPGSRYSLDYFAAHALDGMSQWLFTPDWLGAAAPAVFVGALAGAVLLVRRALRGELDATSRTLLVAAAAPFATTVLVLGYYWGDFTEPNTSRLGIPLFVGALALASFAVHALPARARPWAPAACVLAAAAGFAGSLRDRHYDALSIGPALNVAWTWRTRSLPCRAAWVTPYAGYFLVRGETAIGPQRLRDTWPVLRELAARGEIDGVYGLVVGSVDGQPYRHNPLPDAFVREPLFEAKASAGTRVAVVRMDDPSLPLDPAKDCRAVRR